MKDFNTYQLRLEKSLEEKLFFASKLNLQEYACIVDYGCGTGVLLAELRELVGIDTELIGYDSSPEMISVCKKRYPDISFTSNWEEIRNIPTLNSKALIIFSSVLHEMTAAEQLQVMNNVMPLFDTVVIRDMKRPLNNEGISNDTRTRVINKVAPWQAEMFENKWGKIRDKVGLYRFFLMNEFVENFETEVEEDYFGVLWSEIHWELENRNYQTVFELSYTLPYRKAQVAKLFKHNMQDITHRELIMKKGN